MCEGTVTVIVENGDVKGVYGPDGMTVNIVNHHRLNFNAQPFVTRLNVHHPFTMDEQYKMLLSNYDDVDHEVTTKLAMEVFENRPGWYKTKFYLDGYYVSAYRLTGLFDFVYASGSVFKIHGEETLLLSKVDTVEKLDTVLYLLGVG